MKASSLQSAAVMKWTNLHTGSLFILPAVIFLYCLPDIADAGLIQVKAPTILNTSRDHLKLSCLVDPGFLPDETLVYWLVKDSFVETAFPDGRVQISINESTEFIQSDLIFKSFQDIKNNTFTCVAMNPAGMDTKNYVDQKRRKNRKHKRQQRPALKKPEDTQWMKLK